MNDDALIDLFKEIAQMPPTKRWVTSIEYRGKIDQVFELKLLHLAIDWEGSEESKSYFFEGGARNVSYWFTTEKKATKYMEEVKRTLLFGTGRMFYVGVYSDTTPLEERNA